jgi:hypothetical protein
MIKAIIRKIYSPFQIILDVIRHQRGKRLMMSYTLKINSKQRPYALFNEGKDQINKKINLTLTTINGV